MGSFQIAFVLIAIILSTLLIVPRRSQARIANWFSSRNPHQAKSPITYRQFKFLLIIANAFSVASFINILSSGGGIYIQWFIPQIIIYLSVSIMVFVDLGRRVPVMNLAYAWLLAIAISTAAVVANNPYAWFNWSEQSVLSTHRSSLFPNNYGFQLSSPEYAFYARVRADARRAAVVSGAGRRKATVFSYPNIPTAATTTGLREYSSVKCSVLWFDTCPNNQAAEDLRSFERTPPDVVIWEPIPQTVMTGNEKVFVHGRSALEDWESYRLREVANGAWRQVDKFVSPQSQGWTTYVYAVMQPPVIGK